MGASETLKNRFDACRPAAAITPIIGEFALYQQSGQAWLYNHKTGRVWAVSDPLAWLTFEEKISHAREEVLRGDTA